MWEFILERAGYWAIIGLMMKNFNRKEKVGLQANN